MRAVDIRRAKQIRFGKKDNFAKALDVAARPLLTYDIAMSSFFVVPALEEVLHETNNLAIQCNYKRCNLLGGSNAVEQLAAKRTATSQIRRSLSNKPLHHNAAGFRFAQVYVKGVQLRPYNHLLGRQYRNGNVVGKNVLEGNRSILRLV